MFLGIALIATYTAYTTSLHYLTTINDKNDTKIENSDRDAIKMRKTPVQGQKTYAPRPFTNKKWNMKQTNIIAVVYRENVIDPQALALCFARVRIYL